MENGTLLLLMVPIDLDLYNNYNRVQLEKTNFLCSTGLLAGCYLKR